jgi:hypothetical protein
MAAAESSAAAPNRYLAAELQRSDLATVLADLRPNTWQILRSEITGLRSGGQSKRQHSLRRACHENIHARTSWTSWTQATMSMESHLPPKAERSASGLTEMDRESRPWPQADQAWTVLARRTAEVKKHGPGRKRPDPRGACRRLAVLVKRAQAEPSKLC